MGIKLILIARAAFVLFFLCSTTCCDVYNGQPECNKYEGAIDYLLTYLNDGIDNQQYLITYNALKFDQSDLIYLEVKFEETPTLSSLATECKKSSLAYDLAATRNDIIIAGQEFGDKEQKYFLTLSEPLEFRPSGNVYLKFYAECVESGCCKGGYLVIRADTSQSSKPKFGVRINVMC